MNDHSAQIIKQEAITEQFCDELKSIMTASDHSFESFTQEVITEQFCDKLKSIMTASDHSFESFTQEVITEQFCDELKTIDESNISVQTIKQEIKTEEIELTLTEEYGGFVCPECSEHFYSEKSVVDHVRERHTVYDSNEVGSFIENCKGNICPICWEHFLDDNDFDQHIREHYNMRCVRQNSSQLTSNMNMFYSSDQNENSRTRQIEHINGHTFLEKETPLLEALANVNDSPSTGGKKHQSSTDLPELNIRSEPFSCEFCSSAFTLKGNLLRHQRIHTYEHVEKPYKCQICSFAAIWKCDLASTYPYRREAI